MRVCVNNIHECVFLCVKLYSFQTFLQLAQMLYMPRNDASGVAGVRAEAGVSRILKEKM